MDAVYINHFTLACRPDLKYGHDSQCRISHLCVESCYVTKSITLELNNENGLQQCLLFSPHLKGLERILILNNVVRGGHELFDKMKGVFFKEFMTSYSGHIESVWTSDKFLTYILGGNPRLAQIFVSWIYPLL